MGTEFIFSSRENYLIKLQTFLFILLCSKTFFIVTANNRAIIAIDSKNNREQEEIETTLVTIEEEYQERSISHEVFYPTKEWQKIKEGQTIPAGLHIRINLETGEKEAKLLLEEVEEEEMKDKVEEGLEGETKGIFNTQKKSFTKQELKEALKLFKEGQKDDGVNSAERVKDFRSIDELKMNFKELHLSMETDQEIMAKLIKKYRTEKLSITEKKVILYDLEYYVHQIDNAKDFINMGGLKLLISTMNDTDDDIKAAASFVLGSAVQSNPSVQVEAVENGAIQKLLLLLADFQPLTVRKKAMYAMSSLIRQFPFAQKKFIELGGLGIFSSFFNMENLASPTTQLIKVKAVTLLHDMLVEQRNALSEPDFENDYYKERKKQYKKINLESAVIEQGWCQQLLTLLSSHDHDVREKVLLLIHILLDSCKDKHDEEIISVLGNMKEQYLILAEEEKTSESTDDYFLSLLTLVTDILSKIQMIHLEL